MRGIARGSRIAACHRWVAQRRHNPSRSSTLRSPPPRCSLRSSFRLRPLLPEQGLGPPAETRTLPIGAAEVDRQGTIGLQDLFDDIADLVRRLGGIVCSFVPPDAGTHRSILTEMGRADDQHERMSQTVRHALARLDAGDEEEVRQPSCDVRTAFETSERSTAREMEPTCQVERGG